MKVNTTKEPRAQTPENEQSNDDFEDKDQLKAIKKNIMLVCSCGKKFPTAQGYNLHKKEVREAGGSCLLCQKCNVLFSKPSNLKRHHLRFHTSIKKEPLTVLPSTSDDSNSNSIQDELLVEVEENSNSLSRLFQPKHELSPQLEEKRQSTGLPKKHYDQDIDDFCGMIKRKLKQIPSKKALELSIKFINELNECIDSIEE